MMNFARLQLGIVVLAGAMASCSTEGSQENEQPSRATLFSSSVKNVSIEIDYAEGAEPYTGSVPSIGGPGRIDDVFTLFEVNATRLFAESPKTVSVPSNLGEMEQLTDVVGRDFTTEQILGIADKHRSQKSTRDTVTFYVIWLDGYFRDDGGLRDDVLGVSLGDTGVIAMFKPTIESSAAMPPVAAFVEQSTLIHEFGHAVGLVNNGIGVATAHQDSSHGAHCSNDKCVMYYANEGAAAAVNFVTRYVVTGNEILFDADCLTDVDAFAKANR